MSSQLFSKYLSEIGGIPLLAPEREAELGRIVQTGLRAEATEDQKRASEDAQRELVQKNLKLVVGTAKRFLGGALTLEEMTSDGNQGLAEAAKRFDPAFKTRFSTYATCWIRQAIQQGLYRAHIIRTPGRRARLLCKLLNARSFVEGAREQDCEKLEKETGIPRETVTRVLKGACTLVSINAPQEDGGEPLEASIDSGCESPAMVAMKVEESRMASAALSELGPVERHVISVRFGLDGEAPRTLSSLANVYGVSCECIRQIEKRGLRILRRKMTDAHALPISLQAPKRAPNGTDSNAGASFRLNRWPVFPLASWTNHNPIEKTGQTRRRLKHVLKTETQMKIGNRAGPRIASS